MIDKNKLSPVDIKKREALDFRAGDTLRVWSKIAEEKTSTKANKKTEKIIKFRLQAFEGIVLARKHGKEMGSRFTVRKVASGVGVERIFPLFSPLIDKIEIIKKAKSRRSKLYYIRDKAIKDVRRKLRSVTNIKNKDKEDNTEIISESIEIEKE